MQLHYSLYLAALHQSMSRRQLPRENSASPHIGNLLWTNTIIRNWLNSILRSERSFHITGPGNHYLPIRQFEQKKKKLTVLANPISTTKTSELCTFIVFFKQILIAWCSTLSAFGQLAVHVCDTAWFCISNILLVIFNR